MSVVYVVVEKPIFRRQTQGVNVFLELAKPYASETPSKYVSPLLTAGCFLPFAFLHAPAGWSRFLFPKTHACASLPVQDCFSFSRLNKFRSRSFFNTMRHRS
jgi:hypothetical protein